MVREGGVCERVGVVRGCGVRGCVREGVCERGCV